MVVGFIEGLLRMGTTCTLEDWVSYSTAVLFLFSCIQVFSTFCNSDFFDLSPCRSSFRSFKALLSCFTVIFSRFRKYSPVRSQQVIRFSPSSAIERRPSILPTGLFKPETTSVTSTVSVPRRSFPCPCLRYELFPKMLGVLRLDFLTLHPC